MSLWVPVVAAFGASLLTTLGALALEAQRQRAASRSAAAHRRRTAYIALIQSAHGTLTLGEVVRSVARAQSGLDNSLAIALRMRRPVDPFEIGWKLAAQLTPLLDAQAEVLSCGTPRASAAAKEVASRAGQSMRSPRLS
ncbi:hypothetical protein [Cellulomonas gilvus]|uniref:Uncharacterized protein n=1 Tax=Cellulomonas gilvus (strain ATCC 13127 / NRRL B-14078) TaxID=593907 RepID=F8A624_CELGA|nr:hypothetical protein [Cellulomonas gilvus]AEI11039.1 hypothetical protein Celgi_0517 [Cellulomonas gilvus ATCC 13127]